MANYLDLKPLVLKWEGGLSADPRDSASKFPCPGTVGLDQRFPAYPVHTNKGITWATFNSIIPNKERFLNMKISDWELIWRHYWNHFASDNLPQGIGNYITHWGWGSGLAAASVHIQKVLQSMQYYKGAIDGAFGAKSKAALQAAAEAEPSNLLDRLQDARSDALKKVSSYPVYGQTWEKAIRQLWQDGKKKLLSV